MDEKIDIIGHGVWGKALASVMAHNNKNVSFWDRQTPITDAYAVLLALPTQSIRDALTHAHIGESVKIIINSSKGIEQSSHKLPQQIVSEVLQREIEYYTLIGPSFAGEVVAEMPTLVNIGYATGEQKEFVQHLFQTDYFRVHLTKEVARLELSGALKNVYAIACGLADGMGFGMNTRVKLIVLAMEEMQELFASLGMPVSQDALFGTVGDLILTCNSIASRNFQFGKLLAEYTADQALEKVGTTVEGYFTSSSIAYFQEKGSILPFAGLIRKIITTTDHQQVKTLFTEFLKTA